MEENTILEKMISNPFIFEKIDKKYLSDVEFMIKVFSIEPSLVLRYSSKELFENDSFVEKVLSTNLEDNCVKNLIIKLCRNKIKNNKELSLLAIKENWEYLEYAIDELKDDENFILTEITQNSNILNYTSERLKNDRNFILKAMEIDVLTFHSASEELQNDKKIIYKFIDDIDWADEITDYYFGNSIVAIDRENAFSYITNKEIVKEVVKKHPLSILFASAEMKVDKDIVKILAELEYWEIIQILCGWFSEHKNMYEKIGGKDFLDYLDWYNN